jgi:hypothetical protein
MKHPIVALSFGKGKANECISASVYYFLRLFKNEGYQLILQEEVADSFKNSKVISKHRCPGKYLDTYEVLSQAKEYLCETPTIILIAHPDHLPRTIRTAKMLGFKVIPIPSVRCYDKKDAQWWVRGRVRFFFWNIIANLSLLWRRINKRSL